MDKPSQFVIKGKICPKYDTPTESRFCHNCGHNMEEPYNCCDECGAPFIGKFCSECGKAVKQQDSIENAFNGGSMRCPRCGGENIAVTVVSEDKAMGCMTIVMYVLLALTIFGLLIVIPLMLSKKQETVTYAICQNCGTKWQISQ